MKKFVFEKVHHCSKGLTDECCPKMSAVMKTICKRRSLLLTKTKLNNEDKNFGGCWQKLRWLLTETMYSRKSSKIVRRPWVIDWLMRDVRMVQQCWRKTSIGAVSQRKTEQWGQKHRRLLTILMYSRRISKISSVQYLQLEMIDCIIKDNDRMQNVQDYKITLLEV